MIKHIMKVGNSSALILDRALMELVGLREGGEVQLTVHNGSIIITPAHPHPVDRARFEAALDRVVTERRDVLRRLAE
jgi:antitoxin component of MazEF toxin-antitoxin module